jgi:hypothetical protein
MNHSSVRAFFLIALALGWLALSPQARAVDPPPDGGYPNQNTAEGEDALFSLDTSEGVGNTAIGFQALFSETIGDNNTAIGFQALFSNVSPNGRNTATGSLALADNTNGFHNTATGADALASNITGHDNTATGADALVANTSGNFNTANGGFALWANTIGFNNTAIGDAALLNNTTGSNNIALGVNAGANLTIGDGNIDIGNPGVAGESRTIRVGTRQTNRATFIAGISGATVPAGVAVLVDGSGHLGTITSSARFKDAIKPMDKASEAILALKPVTFYYKQDLDPDGIPQFGLVAEEVEKVNPDLVARDDQGRPYTVRYEAVNAMLLNEFLKEHKKVEQLEATVAKLAAAVEKVSAQAELGRRAHQTVVNNQ